MKEMIYKKVDELIPYVNNPRKNDHAVDAVASSISNFGFKVPIVIDKHNEVVNGHTRLKAAIKLGMEEVPVIVADDLTDDQIRAFRLADNKVAELAIWDEDLLQAELGMIEFNMEQFGFELKELEEEADAVEDNFDEDLPEEPNSQRGEIYQLGRHRVMCGDSTNPEDVKQLMGGEKADLLVTDPPYNVNYQGGTEDKLTIMNDHMTDNNFHQFLVDAFKAADESMKPGAAFYIWHADSEGFNFRSACRTAGWEVRQCLIWVKNALVLGRQDYQWKHEPCLYGWKEGAGHYFIEDRALTTTIEDAANLNKMDKEELKAYIKDLREEVDYKTTILRENKPTASRLHPTMKPVELIGKNIKNSSRKGEKVLDLFGGSGTTMIASEQLGRDAYLMELDPRYVDVIIERYEQFTGDKALKIK